MYPSSSVRMSGGPHWSSTVSVAMTNKSQVNGVNGANGLNSCKCCPYGFHIDTDFVHYCESLLTALYGTNKHISPTLNCRSANSLRRKINSAFSTLNSCSAQSAATDAFLTYCDYNYNKNVANRHNRNANRVNTLPNIEDKELDKESIDSIINDCNLREEVNRFEEAWNESNEAHRRMSNVSYVSESESLIRQNVMADLERPNSPPLSPAPSSCTSSSISRVILSQIRDQMALSLTRVKELEDQIKDIPKLRQKVIILKEEKKRLTEKLEGESSGINPMDDPQNRSRVKELEKIGLITPPVMRRKFLMKSESDSEDDEFGEIWNRSSPPPSTLISSKNIRIENLNQKSDSSEEISMNPNLEKISKQTNTEPASKVMLMDCSTNTEPEKTCKLSLNRLDSVSIRPEVLVSEPQIPSVRKRSIGISTSLAPSLPRKNASIETDLKSYDIANLRELEARRPTLVSWGTDPIRPNSAHVSIQSSPKCADVGTKTEAYSFKSIGIHCTSKDFGLRSNASQTERVLFSNRSVQCSQSCPKCELKQTETIGVGDNIVYGLVGVDKSVGADKELQLRPTSLEGLLSASPVSRTSSAQSIRLCDKCNDAINSVAKDFVVGPNDKTLQMSPTLQSRIPRPIQSTGSLERRTIKDKIIEETANEILVYKNPSLSVGSSPIKRNPPVPIKKMPPKPPPISSPKISIKDFSPRTPDAIKLIDDVFRISEDSDESDEESSCSSDEGTYEVETGAVAKIISRKRVEPSKEIKAALKVLNDNLIKPEKANKSALVREEPIDYRIGTNVLIFRQKAY